MSTVADILDFLDHGVGQPGYQYPVKQSGCCRDDCRRPNVEGHDFCAPCLAWLRFEVDEDPCDAPQPKAPPFPVMDDDEDDPWSYIYAVSGY